MKVAIAYKPQGVVHGADAATSIMRALSSPTSHRRVFTPDEVEAGDLQKHIQNNVTLGFTVHVLDYAESYRAESNVVAFRAA